MYEDGDDTRPLKGLPVNVGHESDPYGSLITDLSARNDEALVLAALGVDLDSDLVVDEGHSHNDGPSRITWHQLLSWDHVDDADSFFLTQNREGAVVTSTSAEDIALLPLILPTVLDEAGPQITSYYRRLRLRFRVSLPSPGSVLDTTLYLKVTFYRADMTDFYNTVQVSAQSSALHPISQEWIEAAVYLGASDIDDSGGRFQLLIQGWIQTAGDKATLWETQVVAE